MHNGKYSTADEFAHDMRLIWKNCQTYNEEGSDISKISKVLGEKFEDMLVKEQLPVLPRTLMLSLFFSFLFFFFFFFWLTVVLILIYSILFYVSAKKQKSGKYHVILLINVFYVN